LRYCFAFSASSDGPRARVAVSFRALARLAVACLLLAGLSLPALSPVALAQGPAPVPGEPGAGELGEVHAEFLTDGELQLEWPEAEAPEPVEPPPGWLRGLADFLGELLNLLGPVFRLLFYGICVILVASIVWFIFRNLIEARIPGLRRKRSEGIEESVAEPYRPDAVAARSLLEEADALAAAGRFAEAVHLLLFRSIEDIQSRREGGVPRSLTAREIARLEALPDRARRGLAPIIEIVERSFFGGRDVDGTGWQSARASYEDFAFGEAWT